jgi:hypothetical protein
MLAPRPTPKLGHNPLSASPRLLTQYSQLPFVSPSATQESALASGKGLPYGKLNKYYFNKRVKTFDRFNGTFFTDLQ